MGGRGGRLSLLGRITFGDEIVLHVGRHVQLQRKGEVGVDLLFQHRDHVECVAHCVEAENLRELTKAGSLLRSHLSVR